MELGSIRSNYGCGRPTAQRHMREPANTDADRDAFAPESRYQGRIRVFAYSEFQYESMLFELLASDGESEPVDQKAKAAQLLTCAAL